MRSILCGFSFGVAALQQCAVLPSRSVLVLYFLLALACAVSVKVWPLHHVFKPWYRRRFAQLRSRNQKTIENPHSLDIFLNIASVQSSDSHAIQRRPSVGVLLQKYAIDKSTLVCRFVLAHARFSLVILSVMVIGFSWAGWRAHERLAFYLPADLERRTLLVEGRIVSLPITDAGSTRFIFELIPHTQRIRSPVSLSKPLPSFFPRRIALSWYPTPRQVLPVMRVGDRWRLKVRLTRIHGTANPYSTDFEAIMLEQNIRARGYVVHDAMPVFLGRADAVSDKTVQHGVSMVFKKVSDGVARWRQTLYDRMCKVLGNAPHKGVITALAIGLQADISAQDQHIFTRTGTNHLVAISGLHIALAAGFVGSLVATVWRRLAYWGFRGPLWIAAPKIAALAGAMAGLVYAALSGWGIPAQRAVIMLCAWSMATLSGREIAASLKLAWALAIVLFVDPWAVVSAGFWLSFGAVTIILLAMRPSRIEGEVQPTTASLDDASSSVVFSTARNHGPCAVKTRYRASAWIDWHASCNAAMDACKNACRNHWLVHGPKYGRAVLEMIRLQVAITLGLIPFTAPWFNQVSWVGPLANLIAIPWVSFGVVPLVLAGVILPAPLDAWAFYGAERAFSGLSSLLEWLSAASWALKPLPAPSWGSLLCATVGMLLWIGRPKKLYHPLKGVIPYAEVMLKILSLTLFIPLAFSFDKRPAWGEFQVTALDVGQGTAAFIETAHHRLLFDTGPSYQFTATDRASRIPQGSIRQPALQQPSTDAGQRIIVPYLRAKGIDRLDGLVISHADSDHAGGAHSVLQALPVEWFRASLPKQHLLWDAARENKKRIQRKKRTHLPGPSSALCQAGEHWVWEGVKFTFLWPDNPALRGTRNAGSCVLRVENKRHAVLLAADIEVPQERELVAHQREALRADILFAPHHGSRTSSSHAFLNAVAAREVIFQMGYLNRFGHPHPTIVARYTRYGVLQHRSDWHGALIFNSAVGKLERYRSQRARYWFNQPLSI